MRFCLQCGGAVGTAPFAQAPNGTADLAPGELPARPRLQQAPSALAATVPPRLPSSTINLKIAATPVMSPRAGRLAELPRPCLHDDIADIDEESLKKSFARRVARPGAVVCRFCQEPLDLGGEYCDHCGAPVAEAAPPGPLLPKAPPPQPALQLNDDPLSPPDATANPAVSDFSPEGAAAGPPPIEPPARAPKSSLPVAPTQLAPPQTPVYPPHSQSAEVPPSGLMGRLKGLFKKS